MAAQIVRLLEDSTLRERLALAAYDTTDSLTWDRVRDRWAAIYRETAPPARGRGSNQARMTPAHVVTRLLTMDRREMWFRASTASRRAAGASPIWRAGRTGGGMPLPTRSATTTRRCCPRLPAFMKGIGSAPIMRSCITSRLDVHGSSSTQPARSERARTILAHRPERAR